LTETAERADVVLPTALWGEKTGTFTNADRTVHLSERAVDPPGMARSDLEIFLDYARRMDLRDRDGSPLISWGDAEGAFEAWKACSRGRPCDYSGLSYARLRARNGIQWPCTEQSPEGTERLYVDHVFPTAAEACEAFGHDLLTGAAIDEQEYRAQDPAGRARLRDADYTEPLELPDEEYPFALATGRALPHFHTRTKTRRAPELQAAAPDPWVEISAADAENLKLEEGDLVAVESRRGRIEAPVRIGQPRPGTLFVPFHFGYFDAPGPDERPRAANELTLTQWDPVSKQPMFKSGAVRVVAI
jgi:predicted molibdopterin-dependent oxidoreductase YjgC